VKPVSDCVLPADEWTNPSEVLATRMELQIVLRSAITNAILSIDRIPVLRSVGDLEEFRSSFDRDYQSPRYAPPHYILPADRPVHIVARNIFQRDGVGNLSLGLYRMLRQHQVAVSLFADNFDLAMNDVINRRETLATRVRSDDIIIYFFSIYDGRLDELVGMKCACKVAYFHGITSPKLLQAFDPELSAQCAKAIDQLPLLSRFDRLAANSRASANTLRKALDPNNSSRSKRISVIPPKLVAASEAVFFPSARLDRKPIVPKFLHVGRVSSHKRIEDVLHLLMEYRKLDSRAQCMIVGLCNNPAYRDFLRWVQTEQLNLPEDAVIWLGSVSDRQLEAIYDEATIYVSMSEHEGFCLPVIESMMRKVLVFAYDQPAIRETMGTSGVVFGNKSFQDLAKRLYSLLSSSETYAAIVEAQSKRSAELVKGMDGRSFIDLLTIRPTVQ
jgi:glycosyltransferase involved in cell wall biosynthesis